jgi:hypothetical protein
MTEMGRMTLYQHWGEVTLISSFLTLHRTTARKSELLCHCRRAILASPLWLRQPPQMPSRTAPPADVLPRRPVKGVGAGGERAPGVGEVAGAEEEVGCAAPACLLSPKGREAGGRASPRRHHGATAGSSSPSPCLAPTAGGVFEARRGCGP